MTKEVVLLALYLDPENEKKDSHGTKFLGNLGNSEHSGSTFYLLTVRNCIAWKLLSQNSSWNEVKHRQCESLTPWRAAQSLVLVVPNPLQMKIPGAAIELWRERESERGGEKAPAAPFMGGMQPLPSVIMKILPFRTILNSPLGRSPDAASVFSENTRGTEFFNLSSFLIILLC